MMSDVPPSNEAAPNRAEVPPKPFSPEDEVAMRESLKRCSAATVEAAVQFRRTRDVALLPTIVLGVIERFVELELRPKLREGDDDLRLVEDLGVDSLTMMETVMLVEEVLQMQTNNDELRNLRTVGDVKTFIDCKVRGLPLPKPTRFLPVEQVAAVMPIQPPFLFINEAQIGSAGAQGKYKITGQEFFLQGHFKDNPVLPASIMLEALGQLAVLFLLEGAHAEPGKRVDPSRILFTSCEGVRCHRICRPGDTLTLSVRPRRVKMPLATFEGSIRVGQDKAAVAEEVTLTFAYADEATQTVGARDNAAAGAPSHPRDAAGGQPPLAAAAVSAS